MINIYNQIKNNSGENSSLPLIENVNETIGFIKIEFYENGNIKQMYYPKDKRFNMVSIDYIREVAELIIPKISSQLFSDNIYEKLDDILKDIDQNKTSTDSPKEIRMRQIRRLAELTPKKVKNKKKKSVIRMLSENNTEIVSESEILPFEKDIDLKLRQIDKNNDNSSNITLISYEDVADDKAKLKGSLDKSEAFTNINDKGMVKSIYQSRNTELMSGYKDEVQDNYIEDNAYINTTFGKDIFEIENETEKLDEIPFNMESMSSNNTNLIDLIDDLTDDNGTIIEYFSSIEYEKFYNNVFEEYIYGEMGTKFLDDFNSTNISISTDEYDENSNTLRNLESDYPYFGQNIVENIKDIVKKDYLGIIFRKYIETKVFPHNGTTLTTSIMVLGSQKQTFSQEITITNNHIITRNKNTMTNELISSLKNNNFQNIFYDIYNSELLDIGWKFEKMIPLKNYYFEEIEYIFQGYFDKFLKAEYTRINNVKRCRDFSIGYSSDVLHLSADKVNYLKDNIFGTFNHLQKLYENKIWDICHAFNSFYNKVHEKLENLGKEYSSIIIYNQIYNEFQSISSKSIKKIGLITKKLQDIYQELKKKLIYFKQIKNDKIKSIIDKGKIFKTEIEKIPHYCYNCGYDKQDIIESIECLIYNKYIENNFFWGLDSIYGINENSFNLSEINYVYYVKDPLRLLYKEMEEKRDTLEYDLYSKSKIKEIEDSLNYLYEKLNNDFFEHFKYNIDKLFNKLKEISYTSFNILKGKKVELSHHSSLIFGVINTTIEEVSDDDALDSLKNNFKKFSEGYRDAFFNDIDYLLNFDFLFDRNFDIEYEDLEKKVNSFLSYIESNICNLEYLEPPYKQFEVIESYFSKLLDCKEMFKNLVENINDFLYSNYLPTLLEPIRLILTSTISKDLVFIQSEENEENSIFFTEKMEKERELLDGIANSCREKIWNAYIPEDTIRIFSFSQYSNKIDEIYNKSITKLYELKDKAFSKYNSSDGDKYQNEKEQFEILLNENSINILISYTNSFAELLNYTLDTEEQKNLIISAKDIEFAEQFFDYMKLDEIKQKITNAYQNYLNNTIDKILIQRIQLF